ncbi:unnamed protein product [Brachionus calyciflorus]|uniref:Uncharacterized protein n=1 Tax=Brachionus calyciflorus TaxID=104777 RepID=A0A813TE63_9BILA|nr:unnamed protein product [Brachionus calyciflorus]
MTTNLSDTDSYLKSTYANSTNLNLSSNSESDLEKTKFFNILKSIFAIFDPECNGSIDINELDVLGANNNEILNDVLNYIRTSRSNKILKAVNQNLKVHPQRHSLYVDKKSSGKFLVDFDEFVNAAEIVLDRRKQNKILNSRTSGTTLSQAFENHNYQNSQSNANSLDLNSLIDKENFLLKQGLDSIDSIKQWFTNQLIENKVKQANFSKLKYQNLFSIDKLLIDLKQLNDLNLILNEFLIKKKLNMENIKQDDKSEFLLPEPPSYHDYVEQFSAKQDFDLDVYLKEKQDKIDSLQKEKSNLIRKLFEIKAESENINKNILKLNSNTKDLNRQNSTINLAKKEKELPIVVEKNSNNFNSTLPIQSNSSAKSINSTILISKPRFL